MFLLTNYRDPTAVRSTRVRHGRSVDRVCHWSLVSCIGVGLVSRYDIPRGDRQGMRNLVPYRFVLGVVHCIAFFFLFHFWLSRNCWSGEFPYLADLLGEMMEPEKSSITVLYFVTSSGGILYLTWAVTLVLAFTSLGDATWNIRDYSLDYLYTSCIDLLWFAILSNPGVHKQIESNTFSS